MAFYTTMRFQSLTHYAFFISGRGKNMVLNLRGMRLSRSRLLQSLTGNNHFPHLLRK